MKVSLRNLDGTNKTEWELEEDGIDVSDKPRRVAVLDIIQGGRLVQDIGTDATLRTIAIRATNKMPIDTITKDALVSKYEAGGSYLFADEFGVDWTVFIQALTYKRISGLLGYWSYELTLIVVA